MVKEGISVHHAESDDDCKICVNAIGCATKSPTAVVAEDSDVFQLMVHYANVGDSNLCMVTVKNTVCITTLKKELGPPLLKGLLFLHAISGCDTTSRPHGIRKVTVLKKNAALKNSITIFMSPCSSKEDIERAGVLEGPT